jgi:hypothetical protein
MARDECRVFGVAHPPKDPTEAAREAAEDLTAVVQSKFSEALLSLLVALAHTGRAAR